MRKLFQQIDDLCRNARTPLPICVRLGLDAATKPGKIFVRFQSDDVTHELPDSTNLRWRRVWRAFLTDHVDDVANSLAAVPAAVPGGQPAATA